MSDAPRYKFTYKRVRIGWGKDVHVEVYAENEKTALAKVEALTDRGDSDWYYELVSVQEVDDAPQVYSLTYNE